jgi:hypothetical protein
MKILRKMETETETKRVCLKKKFLYVSVGDWLDDDHIYIGRRMGSFLTSSCDLPDTEWLNPFRVAKNKSDERYNDNDDFCKRSLDHSYLRKKGKKIEEWKFSLKTSLELFENYMRQRLDDEIGLIVKLLELKGKTIGCYCLSKDDCHGDVLIKLINEFFLIAKQEKEEMNKELDREDDIERQEQEHRDYLAEKEDEWCTNREVELERGNKKEDEWLDIEEKMKRAEKYKNEI